MTTTLVDLPTLRGLAALALEHGTSAQFMDMALDFATAAELHIAHLEQLLSDKDIVCSCESMLLIDAQCLLHGYSVDPDDPPQEVETTPQRGWDEQAQAIGYRNHQHYLEENADPMALEDQELPQSGSTPAGNPLDDN